jgi:hypothetical protein
MHANYGEKKKNRLLAGKWEAVMLNIVHKSSNFAYME